MTATTAKRQPNRWPALLDAAAAQFAERGYHATSMRELAAATAMTAGRSIFTCRASKSCCSRSMRKACSACSTGWRRPSPANASLGRDWKKPCGAHLESILDASAYARVLIRILPATFPRSRRAEGIARPLRGAASTAVSPTIELPRERDATIARLALLGAMNWTPVWYKQSGKSVPAIARELLAPLARARRRQGAAEAQMTAGKLSIRPRACSSPRSGSTGMIAAAASSRLICATPAWK